MTRKLIHFGLPVAFLLSCGVLLHSRTSPQVLPVRLQGGFLMNALLQLDPPAGTWQLEGLNDYYGNGYHLSFEQQAEGSISRVKVVLARDDQQKFTVQDFHAAWELWDPDLFAIWTY